MDKTLEERYKDAMRAITKMGVKTYRNVQGCCRSCIGNAKFDEPTTPILWNYGGQGNRIKFHGNYVMDLDGYFVDNIYLYHSLITPLLTQSVMAIFQNHGIVAEWDGSEHSAIIIRPKLSVPNRDKFDQATLVNNLLNKYSLTYEQMFDSYQGKRIFEKLWDKGFQDDQVEAVFEDVKDSVDKKIASEIRWKAERAEREHQKALTETLLENLSGYAEVDRLKAWLKTTNQQLSEFDVKNPDTLIIMETQAYQGLFEGRIDFAKYEMRDSIDSLPDWAKISMDWIEVWRRELEQDYTYANADYHNIYVWKRG